MTQDILDWLFRIGLYRGIRVKIPSCMILTARFIDGQFSESVTLSLDDHHPMAAWLLEDCDGPWKIKAQKSDRTMIPYLTFARVDDAVIFSLWIR